MSSRWPFLIRCILATGLFLLNIEPAFADYALNMTKGVSPVSANIYHLHMVILWVCVAISVIVYGLMLYAIIRHRKSAGYQAATFHESTTIEIIWTIIPFVILIIMAVPATRTLIEMHDSKNADLTIKVTGYRWYWNYDYIDDNFNFFSYLSTNEDELQNFAPKSQHYLLEVDKPMVVPVGKKVRLLLTAKDVIHSWWVPSLGVKKDAIPGFINETWFYIEPSKPGTYRGQCAELCGVKHGYMPIVVEAKSEQDYAAWIAEQKKGQVQTTSQNSEDWAIVPPCDDHDKKSV